jgi:SAM-dependent methyltransferase
MSGAQKPIRRYLKTVFPRAYALLRKAGYPMKRIGIMERSFTRKYLSNAWNSPESRSGPGSTLQNTTVLRRELPKLLQQFHIKRLLDIPCGDFHWMKETELDLEEYIGADVVEEIIGVNRLKYSAQNRRFVVLDITDTALPKVDLIVCRDCLVHFDFRHIRSALKRIVESGSTFFLSTTFTTRDRNVDILTGEWRPLNLEAPPFGFPQPLLLINEQSAEEGEADKSFGLWRISDIAPGALKQAGERMGSV